MKRALVEIARQPATCVAVLLITAVVFAAIAAPWLAPFSPDTQPFDGLSLDGAPLPPGSKYWLGTDTLGRDLLSRLLYGARTSLMIGLVANGVAVMIGMIVGVVAGYVSGFVGNALMRFTDLMMAFPALLLAIVLAALLRPSLWIVALVIALVNWVQVARIIYTETRGLVERDFVLAERSLGAGHMRILFRHIAPHLLPSAIVWGTLGVATTVLLEATLSFLGVGVQPPQPSWGNIIYESQSYFQAAPWLVFIPGVIILATALCFNLVGDALRDLLDPNSTGTRLMATLLARRVLQSVAVLLGVAVITFLLLHYLPADPAALVAGRSANAQIIANVRHQLGLDLPLPLQFWRYLTGLARGDLGRSYIQRSEVTTLIMARIPATLVLMACGILVEVALGLTFGVIAAVRRNGFVDRIVMMFAFVGVSSPQFVVALLLLYVFAARLGWFPMSGFGTPAHVVLPALTLGLLGAGWYARMVRSAMIDVLNQDYVRTARAKGLSWPRVVLRHALPNALLPIVAMIGIDIGQFMGGVVVVEAVYGWPGIGQLAWQAIQEVDVPIIMGVTLVSSLAIVLGNLLADLIAPVLDPRIRVR